MLMLFCFFGKCILAWHLVQSRMVALAKADAKANTDQHIDTWPERAPFSLLVLLFVNGMAFRQLRVVILAHFPRRFWAPFKVSLPRIFPLSCKIQISRSWIASASLIWSSQGIPFASLTEPCLEKKKNKGACDITAGSDLEETERSSGKTDRWKYRIRLRQVCTISQRD